MFELKDDEAPLFYASCHPVSGSDRVLIYDLQRQRGLSLPGDFRGLLDRIEQRRGETLRMLLSDLTEEEQGRLRALLQLLLEKEVLTFSPTPERFPRTPGTWQHPSRLVTALVDVAEDSQHAFAILLPELETLGCERLSLRIATAHPLETLDAILRLWQPRGILTLDVQIAGNEEITPESLRALCRRCPRLAALEILNHRFDRILEDPGNGFGRILYRRARLNFLRVRPPAREELIFNQALFFEAQRFNPFLHRRVCIDVDGLIRNAPGTAEHFGPYQPGEIELVLNSSSFQRCWTITKDLVVGCDVCEFRYACVDPRLPAQDSSGRYRHETGCHCLEDHRD